MKYLRASPVIFTLFHILLTVACIEVSVYTSSGFYGEEHKLQFSSCLPELDAQLDKSISAINTHNNCAHLYKEKGCVGPYLVVRPGSPSHDVLSHYGFSNNVRSIGTCFKPCHPDKSNQLDESHSTNVEIYGRSSPTDGEIPQETLTLKAGMCLDMTFMDRWNQPGFRVAVPTPVCVEIHEFPNCTGHAAELSVGTHTTKSRITYWPDRTKTRAISYCGYNCDDRIKDWDEVSLEIISEGTSTWKRLQVHHDGQCTQIPASWKPITETAMINSGSCVALYSSETCEENSFLEFLYEDELYLNNAKLAGMRKCDDPDRPFGLLFWFLLLCLVATICGLSFLVWKKREALRLKCEKFLDRMRGRSHRRGGKPKMHEFQNFDNEDERPVMLE